MRSISVKLKLLVITYNYSFVIAFFIDMMENVKVLHWAISSGASYLDKDRPSAGVYLSKHKFISEPLHILIVMLCL